MGEITVFGKRRLEGKIDVCGSKNAALPLIFATLIIEGVSTLYNVPDISDVDCAIEMLKEQGAEVVRAGSTLTVDARRVAYAPASQNLSGRIRASTYLLGAQLSRFGISKISDFGGCSFAPRPIDMHLYAATRLGAKVDGDLISADGLLGAEIVFDKPSVGASVNALIMASRAKGKTEIINPALEPHVGALIGFLRRAGVKIEVSRGKITVYGSVPESATFRVIPDMIEAGTFISLSLITDSKIKISGASPRELSAFLEPLVNSGVIVSYEGGFLSVEGEIERPLTVKTAPYPGFATDLQPIIAPLMLKNHGGSITETVFSERFSYLEQLVRLGGGFTVSKNRAELYSGRLIGARVRATDLRGGAALLIAALGAEGESVIENAELIYRGYERIEQRLSKLGADLSSAPFVSRL